MPQSGPIDGILEVAPGRDLPLHVAQAAVTAAVREACARGMRGVLVDFHDWSGGRSPSLAMRIGSTKEWAAIAAPIPGFAMVLVMPPAMVDPGRIGPVLGRGLGFNFNVCGSVDEARDWLADEVEAARARQGP